MSLSSLYLDAFAEVAKCKSFSAAARKLNVTQSALSQRVLNLEGELGSSLFIRHHSGLQLTELGQRLLRYCQSKSMLEGEFLETLGPEGDAGLSGLARVGSFSTVARSVLLPILGDFVKHNPRVSVDLRKGELRELPGLLFSGAVDFVLIAQAIDKAGVENHLLGYEEYVLIRSPSRDARPEIYLDFDEEDMITYDFFKLQSRGNHVLKRNFLGDIYSLIDGVKMGLGRAIVPLHLVEDLRGIEVVKGHKSLKIPVYLSYYAQPFYSKLHAGLTEAIRSGAANFLRAP